MKKEDLGELVNIAFEIGADYHVLRCAVIRREVEGQRVGRRWYVSLASARRWQRERTKAEPAPAA